MSAPVPTASFNTGSVQPFVGGAQALDISFVNSGDATGYKPYVTVEIPSGLAVVGPATYLGAPVAVATLTFDAAGHATNPYAFDATGAPLQVDGTPGDTLVVLELPFGSFTVGQTPVTVTLNLQVQDTADVSKSYVVHATAGFAWGGNVLGTAQPDWPVVQDAGTTGNTGPTAASAALSVSPSLVQVTETYNGPEQESATGTQPGIAASAESWTAQALIAAGHVVTDLTLDAPLPNGAVATQFTVTLGGVSYIYTVDPLTGLLSGTPGAPPVVISLAGASGLYVYYDAAGGDFRLHVASATGGTGNAGPSITTQFAITRWQSLGHAFLTAAAATAHLVLTDMLPTGAIASMVTFTDVSGIKYVYSANASTGALTQVAGPSTGQPTLSYDAANGRISADFGAANAGQAAAIDAVTSGGMSYTSNQASGVADAFGDLRMVAQLNGLSDATGFTLTAGGVSVAYDVESTGNVTVDAANTVPAGWPAIVGSAPAAGSAGVFYDAVNHRIVADFGTGYLVAGTSGGVSARVVGGATLDENGQQDFNLSSSPVATYTANQAGAVGAQTTGLPAGAINGELAGANIVTGKIIALQKSVVATDANGLNQLSPGGELRWSITGEVSNFYDVNNIVVTDILSDGQHFDPAASVTLTFKGHSQPIPAADYTVLARSNTDGTTTIVFHISDALMAQFAQTLGDLNGGQAATDPTQAAAAATFGLAFGSVIDQTWLAHADVNANTVEQNDSITDSISVTGNVIEADGSQGAQVTDSSGAGVTLAHGQVGKAVYEIVRAGLILYRQGGIVALGSVHVQSGDEVVWRLTYDMPITHAQDFNLTDFLPLPLFQVGSMSFDAGQTADLTNAGDVPAVGSLVYDSADTFRAATGDTPTITTDVAANSVRLDFGNVTDGADPGTLYPSTNVDLLFASTVANATFGDSLLFTNQVSGQETNSAGVVTTSNAIVQVVTGAPQLTIEKGAVATSDVHATATGSLAGIRFNGTNAAAGFSGTIDNAALSAGALTGGFIDLDGSQAGDIVRYALVVHNLGHGASGAWDVLLHDTALPPGATLLGISVVDGNGNALGYTNVGGGLFDPNGGIELTNPATGNTNALTGVDATDGSNVAVVFYDVSYGTATPADGANLPDTAVITQYTDQPGGVNRAATGPQADLTSSATIATALPTITKSFVSATLGDDLSHLKIGETATFDIAVTFTGGVTDHVVITDPSVLTAGGSITFQSAGVLSIGGDLGFSTAAAAVAGGFSLGDVTDRADTRGAADTVIIQVVGVATGADSDNVNGSSVVNVGTLASADPNHPGSTLTETASLAVTIAAPVLHIVKQVEDLTSNGTFAHAVSANAGDRIEYRIDLTNTGGAAAYAVELKDLLNQLGMDALGNPAATLEAGSITVDGVATTATTIDATLTELDPNATLEVTYVLDISRDANFGQVLNNTATDTAQTLPPSDTADTGFGRALTGSAAAVVTVFTPSDSKTLVAGSDPSLAVPNLAVGETGTFQLVITVPEGDSSDLTVIDLLPSGLVYVAGSASVTSADASVGNALGGNATVDANGHVVFDFGAVHSVAAGGHITIDLQATLSNTAGNQPGGTVTNGAAIIAGGHTVDVHGVTSVIDQPNLVVSKANVSGALGRTDAGTVASYSVTLNPVGGTSDAYNVVWTDVLGPDQVIAVGSVHSTAGFVSFINSNTIVVTLDKLAPADAAVVLTYTATTADTATPGETLTDSSSATYDTQSLTDTSSGTIGRALTSNTATASQTVVLTPSITKVEIGSTDANTVAGSLAVGETVTYEIVAQVQHGTQSLSISDLFASGMTAVSSSVTGITGLLDSQGNTMTVAEANADKAAGISYNLGTIVNDAGVAGSVTIDVVGTVTSHDIVGQNVADTATITSAAPSGAGAVSVSATAGAIVVKPDLTLVKVGSLVSGLGDAGSVYSYTITLAPPADSNGPAYSVDIRDTLPADMIVGVVTATNVDTHAATQLTAINGVIDFAPGTILAGAHGYVISYDETVANSAQGGETLTDTAAASYTTQPNGAGDTLATLPATVVETVPRLTVGIVKTIAGITGPTYGTDAATGASLVTQGDTITYQLVLSPEHGTNHLTMTDPLPAGLTFVSVADIANGGSAPAQFAFADTDGTLTVDFGNVVDPSGNNGLITLDVVGVVTAADGATLLNHASDTSTGSGAPVVSNSGTVEIETIQHGSIGGTVFTDQNANGIHETADLGLAGVIVDLLQGAVTVATLLTDASGSYDFGHLLPGSYTVAVQRPVGDLFTVRDAALPADSSVVDATTGQTVSLTLGIGQDITHQDAGVYMPVSLSGTVFNDANDDGFNNDSLPGEAGVTVTLLGATGAPVTTTVTDASGHYSFANLTPGSYGVSVTPPVGTVISPRTSTINTAGDSDVSAAGVFASVTLTSGQAESQVDAGLFTPGALSGHVFFDSDDDGLQDNGEANQAGIVVHLIGGNGQTAITDALGNYTFLGLNPGNYAVRIDPPTNYQFSPANIGTNPADNSHINPATGLTSPIAVIAGQTTLNQDAGMFLPGSLSGHVFTDLNADGVQEASDAGLAGVTVQLLDHAGKAVLGAHGVAVTATTAPTGFYQFTGLVPGSYEVRIDPPAGQRISPVGANTNPTLDSVANPASGVTLPVQVLGAANTPNQNAGVYAPVSLTGNVFYDHNDDGAFDGSDGDHGIAGVVVTLLDGLGHAHLDGSGKPITTLTDAIGNYVFSGLIPGTYAVQVGQSTGYVFSPAGVSTTFENSVVGGAGRTAPVAIVSGQTSAGNNAGEYAVSTLSGHAFLDGNCSGVQNPGDPAIGGITVKLLDASGHDTGKFVVTDQYGNYSFDLLEPGQYSVLFVPPTGLDISDHPFAGGANDSSDADPTTGISQQVTLAPGQETTDLDVGLELNGNYPNQTPIVLANGQSLPDNNASGGNDIVGTGNNNVHTTGGHNVVSFDTGSNVFESGTGTDFVTSCGALNAQGLGANDFIFGGPGGDTLQGGGGNDYLVGGTGNDLLAAGAGTNTLDGGGSTGTVTLGNGLVTGYSIGDEFRTQGTTTILYQAGDGTDLLDTFDPAHSVIKVYGYAGVNSAAQVNGHTVLYFGANDAIVMNDHYALPTANPDGSYTGVAFAGFVFNAASTAAPLLTLRYDTNGLPYLVAPVATPPDTLTSPYDASAQLFGASGGGQTLQAGAGAFTVVGGVGGHNTLLGGAGNDLLWASGGSNTITALDGNNTIYGGELGGSTVTAQGGNNLIVVAGAGNTATAGDGNNIVFAQSNASKVNLGNGNNEIIVTGATNTITAGDGNNVLFLSDDQGSTGLHLGTGANIVVATGNVTLAGTPGDTATQQVWMNGPRQAVTVNAGSVIVGGGTGTASVTIHGGGTHLVALGGTGNDISIDGGTNTVFTGSGGSTLKIGSGTSTVVAATNDTISVGAGHNAIFGATFGDTIILTATPVVGPTDILGFTAGNSDMLDLSKLLAGTPIANDLSNLGNYVVATAINGGVDTMVGIDATGQGHFGTVADLRGFALGTSTTASLVNQHILRI